jgi:hypothetical protein
MARKRAHPEARPPKITLRSEVERVTDEASGFEETVSAFEEAVEPGPSAPGQFLGPEAARGGHETKMFGELLRLYQSLQPHHTQHYLEVADSLNRPPFPSIPKQTKAER